MSILPYDRNSVLIYAKRWSYERNPAYYNFDDIGGDCTNFVSQCIFSGSRIMNYDSNNGWYYLSTNNRAPSWTSVEFLYDFLTENKGIGPFGIDVLKNQIEIGDVVQLGDDNSNFYHTMIVTKKDEDQIYVASHSLDSFDRPLSSYIYANVRFIHILGIRTNN